MKSPKGKTLTNKYDMDKGSLTWRERMKSAYKSKGLKAPDKFKSAKSKALNKKAK